MSAALRSHRGRRWLRPMLLGGLLPLLAFACGLVWFATTLPTAPDDPQRSTDAIVVLTGGRGRLSAGIELLAAGQAEKLFVSGVYRGVEVGELLRLAQRAPDELSCCIALGYDADDTHGNARESAAWMREQGYRSLRLVTSAYHMPRSLLEFRRALPRADILQHPVVAERFRAGAWWRSASSLSLVASEFGKYLVALARGWLPSGVVEATP